MTKKSVKKFTPQTRCEKVPVELCGPAGCGVKPGPEECQVPAEIKLDLNLLHYSLRSKYRK